MQNLATELPPTKGRSSALAVAPRAAFAMQTVPVEIPYKHEMDEKRLLIVVDMRTQSYDPAEWHLVERFLREQNPRRVWFSDVHPVTIEQVVSHRDPLHLMQEIMRLGADEIMRRIDLEKRARLDEGWNVVINRWQTFWL